MLVNIPCLTRCLDAGAVLIAGDIVAYRMRTYRITNLVCALLGQLSPSMIDLVSLAAFVQEIGHWDQGSRDPMAWLPHTVLNGERMQAQLLRDMVDGRRSVRRHGEPILDAYRTAHWVNAWPVLAMRSADASAMTRTLDQFPRSGLDTILKRRFVAEIGRGLLGSER